MPLRSTIFSIEVSCGKMKRRGITLRLDAWILSFVEEGVGISSGHAGASGRGSTRNASATPRTTLWTCISRPSNRGRNYEWCRADHIHGQ